MMIKTNRRTFLKTTFTVAGSCLLPRYLPATTTPTVTVTADFAHPVFRIPGDFVGLSFETSRLIQDNYLVPESTTLIRLIRQLGPSGVLRIGGGASNDPLTQASVVTQGQLTRFAQFLRATNWKLIWGLKMAHGTPAEVAAEAQTVWSLMADRLVAFQFGNEPDLWAKLNLRNWAYNPDAFASEWQQYAAAVRRVIPNAPFAGPDIAYNLTWLGPFVSSARSNLRFLSFHHYAGIVSDTAQAIHILEYASGSLVKRLKTAISLAGGMPWRVTEYNTFALGGVAGASDTFIATLWGIDTAFTIANYGSSGVNLHSDQPAWYSPIWKYADGTFHGQPSYHALAFFNRFGRGSPCPITITGAPPATRAFALRGDDAVRRLVLLNLSPFNALNFRLPNLDGAYCRLHTLTANSVMDAAFTFDGVTARSDGLAYASPGQPMQLANATVFVPETSGVVVEIN